MVYLKVQEENLNIVKYIDYVKIYTWCDPSC